MLFITNRVLNEGPTPRVNGVYQVPRSVSFKLSDNQALPSVYLCRRNAENDYTEIGSIGFFSELKEANVAELFLYFHGYSSLPEPAIFPRAVELQQLFDQKSPGYIKVIPVIWPCDDDLGQIGDYFDDQIAADKSGIAYARLFQKFLSWREANSTVAHPCTKRINILSHSMGNRVLRAALNDTVHYFLPQGMPLVFRNIFMAAADLVNEALEPGKEAQYIAPSTRNAVVYYASDDLAMRASKVANAANKIASRRLGHTGPERIDRVDRNVFAVDCDDFNTLYDPPVGHGYFGRDRQGNPGQLFNHMWQTIQTGRAPMDRPASRTSILRADGSLEAKA